MRLPRLFISVLLAMSGGGGLPAALCQTGADPSTAASMSDEADMADPAQQAFERGKTLYGQYKFVEASDAFREAYRLRPSWRLLYNVGQSEAAATRLGLALEAFEAYLTKGGDEVDPQRAEEVRREIRRLRDLVGFVDVRAADGIEIFVDHVSRGQTPLPGALPVAAGVIHMISIGSNGGEAPAQEVKVSGGQTAVVDLRPEKSGPRDAAKVSVAAPLPDAKAQDSVSPTGRLMLLGWSTAGLGAVLLLTGTGTGAAALSLNSDIESGCPDGHCDASFTDKLSTRDNLAVATDVLLGIGGAAVAAGVAIILVGKFRKRESNAPSIEGAIGPTVAGAQLKWTF